MSHSHHRLVVLIIAAYQWLDLSAEKYISIPVSED